MSAKQTEGQTTAKQEPAERVAAFLMSPLTAAAVTFIIRACSPTAGLPVSQSVH